MSTTLWNFESKVSATIVDRGRSYYRRGRVVKLSELAEGEWSAQVKGSSAEYEVNISMEEGQLKSWDCECPYDWGSMCKHVVATLFKIREKQPANPATELAAARRQRAAEILAQYRSSISSGNPPNRAELLAAARVDEPQPVAAPNRSSEELLALYDTLPESERRVLKIAALVWEMFSKTKFVEVFNDSNFKVNGLNLNDRDAARIFDQLHQLGFLLKLDTRFRVNLGFAQALCDRDFVQDPDFRKTLVPIRRRMELSTYWTHGFDVVERNFREMRLAYYERSPEKFKTYFWGTIQHSTGRNAWTQESLLEWWLPPQFDLQKLEACPAGVRWFLLDKKLTSQVLDLHPPDGYFHYTVEKLADMPEPVRADMARLVAQTFLLQGNFNMMNAVLKHTDAVDEAVFSAIMHLLNGDAQLSNEAFSLATKALRAESRNPKSFLTNLAGLMQVIAQFKTQNAALYPKIEDHLAKATKNVTSYFQAFRYLQAVLQFLQNEKKQAQQTLSGPPPATAFLRFFQNLTQFWIDEAGMDRERLAKDFEALNAAGYHWLAAENLAMLAELEPDYTAHQEELAHRLAELGTEPLAYALPRVEEWENALNSLFGMGANTKAPSTENDTRLVWFVDFERKQLQPKEQTFGKKGWTAGRNVAEYRLGSGDVKCMTEQDHRIVKAMGYSGNYYVNPYNFDKACSAMVGHPLLFLLKSPDVAVQLLEEKLTLIAQKTEDGFRLCFSRPVENEGIKVVKESPTRYKLLNVSAEQLRIARAFNGASLFVPDRGADRLRETISGLANIVTIQSVFEDENLPSVSPDARPCLHLLPVGDGFHVEMLAKPFGDTPPYFKTAEGEPSVTALRDGQRVRTTRDLKAERKNADAFREQVEVLRDTRPRNGVWELEDADQCLELLTQIHSLVQAGSVILEWPKGEKFRVSQIVGFDQFKLKIGQQNDWFEVSGEIRVDESRVLTMQELLALSERSKGRFIELSPGKFLALTNEFRRRLRQINGLMSPHRNGSLQLHPLAAPALEDFTDLVKNFEFDQKFKENRERLRTAFSSKFKLPKKFNATLRPYQLEGFEWLSRCAAGGMGACLADDMGLGKTVQALALLTSRAALGPALVVAPASVCRNWMIETEKFAPALQPNLFGEGDRANMVDKAQKGDIVVVTYDLMAREAEHFIQKKWATVILDEAQNIKNRATKRSETAMELQADFKIVMTGTPLENHLGELWNLFQFANPGLLGSLDSFNQRFATPIERYGDDNRRDQLRRLVQPFVLRRRKDEVLKELPAKTEITLNVELTPDERAFYEALRRTALEKLVADDPSVGAGEKHLRILAEIMRLRRAACHPNLVDENAGFNESSKLRLFGEIVEELLENGHKALVFSQFVTHLQILETYLKQKKIVYQYLDGQTALPTRQKRIEAFQRGEGDLFLISLKAGGVGLNLTAADYVIHMDPWWNPAVEDQATDRAHRIGQEKPVTVYRIVAGETIEEKILKLHEHKRDLADGLLNGADMSAKLSAEELLKLISER